jgi:hypothetical protein
MVTVIVEFKLPRPVSTDEARETFLNTAPKYKGMTTLIRKYYFLSQDGTKAGGIYLWNSREDADRTYTGDWKTFVCEKYGSDPSLTYLACPVVVDNLSNEIISD